MKKLLNSEIRNLVIILLIVLQGNVTSAQVPAKICNWQDDKKAAVVLTFDDWSPGHYPIVVPELASRNLNATFFLMLTSVASWNHPWPDVVTAAANGNEMGNHTKNHPNLSTANGTTLHDEITNMKTLIDQNVTGQTVLSFAYPFGAYNAAVLDTLKKSGHIGARTVVSMTGGYGYNFAPTELDYFKIKTYAMGSTTTIKNYKDEIDKTITGGGMLTFLYHSIDNSSGTYGDNWYARVLQDSLQKQLDLLVNMSDKIWVTTFSKAIRYHKEKNSATLTEIEAANGTTWKINLTDTLSNNSIYNIPLTIKLKVSGINYNQITQNGNSIAIESFVNDSITFKAIPDNGTIILSTSAPLNNRSRNDFSFSVYPNPGTGRVFIQSNTSVLNAAVMVYNTHGQLVSQQQKNIHSSDAISIDLSDKPKGVYIIDIVSEGIVSSNKIVIE